MKQRHLTLFKSTIQKMYRSTLLLALTIIALGICLRAYQYGTYAFGFDQVQILENAQRIKSGDVTLIGPRTGPAAMFTGPLIYYVTAVLLFIIPSPFVIVVTSVVLATITGLTLFLLASYTLSRSQTLTLVVLWAISPFLVLMDRVPWNPNLSILASSFVFFPLYRLYTHNQTTQKQMVAWCVLLSVGGFLGYQAHLSGVMFPAIVLLTGILLHRWKLTVLTTVVTSVGLLASLLPTIFFDWRHEWLNVKGFLELGQSSSGAGIDERLRSVFITVETVIQNFGRIFFWNTNKALSLLIGVAVLFFIVRQYLQSKDQIKQNQLAVPLLWIAVSTFFYTFYRGSKPEYYFLIQIPAVLLLLNQSLFAWLRSVRAHQVFMAILVTYAIFHSALEYKVSNGMNLANQYAASTFIFNSLQNAPVSKISYDMEAVHALGLQYLLKDLPIAENGKNAHLIYPYAKGSINSFHSNDVGVWMDTRDTVGYQYVTQANYIIGSPLDTTLYPDVYPSMKNEGADRYLIYAENKYITDITVINRIKHKEKFISTTNSLKKNAQSLDPWEYFSTDEFTGWKYESANTIVLASVPEDRKESILPVLNSLEIQY